MLLPTQQLHHSCRDLSTVAILKGLCSMGCDMTAGKLYNGDLELVVTGFVQVLKLKC